MDDILDVIKTRRSCRNYKPIMIEKEKIDKIVEAGKYAPSGMNLQSCIMLVVTNKSMRDKLSKLNAKILNSATDPFYGAPVVIVVLAKKDVKTCVYDGSVLMQNLMLEAHSLGVASCWIHRAKEMFETPTGKEILKSLGINDEYEGIGNCVLGYALDSNIAAKPRKDNFAYYLD